MCSNCTDISISVEARLNDKKYKNDMNDVKEIRDDLKSTASQSDMINITDSNIDYNIVFTPVNIKIKSDKINKKLLYVGANKFWDNDTDTVELLNNIS